MNMFFANKYLDELEKVYSSEKQSGRLIILTGRHKVGKTSILTEFLKSKNGMFLTVNHKSAELQLNDVSKYLRGTQYIEGFIPSFRNWREFFEFLFFQSKDREILLVLDEFQNLDRSDPLFFKEFGALWNRYSGCPNFTMVAASADTDFLEKVLYGDQPVLPRDCVSTLTIEPFTFQEVLDIYSDNGSRLPMSEIFRVYAVFGGIPKYYALMSQFNFWDSTLQDILAALLFRPFAPLGFEMKELIVNEFTRNNTTYLAILQAIASGRNTVTEIARTVSIPATSAMKYISELERRKVLIKRKNPVGTDDPSRSKYGKYFIINSFENFWFRFIQPNHYSYEMGQFEVITSQLSLQLESYIQEQLPKIIREIIGLNRSAQQFSHILNPLDSVLGETWTREVVFDVAILQNGSGLSLGRLVLNHHTLSRQFLDTLKLDVKAIFKQYQNHTLSSFLLLPGEPDSVMSAELSSRQIPYITYAAIFSTLNYTATQDGTSRVGSFPGVLTPAKAPVERERKKQPK